MHQDLIFSQVENKLRPISRFASPAGNTLCVSVRKKTETLGHGCFLLRANDKFSDNRHVLIDVSAPLTQTTGGLHQGYERYEELCICTAHSSLYCTGSYPICPTLKALMHGADSPPLGQCNLLTVSAWGRWYMLSHLYAATVGLGKKQHYTYSKLLDCPAAPQRAALWRGLMYL